MVNARTDQPVLRCIGMFVIAAVSLAMLSAVGGCGTTRAYEATEQLVISDAVDSSISKLDFRPLTGRKVYLDAGFIRYNKNEGFVNSDYVISALRQQIVSAGCLIQDTPQAADIIIEARLGTLGLDDHRVTFGIPENNALSTAAQIIPGSPAIPAIPEIALTKRESREGAAKVAAFAYDRETRVPVWQSGVGTSVANAQDTWVFGVGPFQAGSVRDTTKFAGREIGLGHDHEGGTKRKVLDRPPVNYTAETHFQNGYPIIGNPADATQMIEGPGQIPIPVGGGLDVPSIATGTSPEPSFPANSGADSASEPITR